ncbi:peptidoglycan/xylan/chitin deacetylase (PgdA/CDA1 family) [Sphaerotilus hippei]|uniref:Peptidoglycan/xylan/chitin deacetylase (PgdA/CDA1 family) n=1 Tax=Sphaerotilus hippei TaxID=744406 RepID=A0A318H138_9BURK|nr:polysaccharide deacetylase family protein [Sphaerotilus hippei]PXW96635.1 peptidoglycan/xylan/chitin deacetylase (PgdA/CDA1 family) [Sphaerotilus hippei]
MSALPSRQPTSRWPLPPLLQWSALCHLGAVAWPALRPQDWPWALALLGANHALLTATGLWPRSTWLGANVTRLPAASAARREIALTLDDGPDPEVTPAVLDLLDRAGARATFFCIGRQAMAHPQLLREIVVRGHSVQNHSLRHDHRFSLSGPGAFRREVEAGQQALQGLTGVRPTCFRAPAGLRNPFLAPVLHRLGLHLVSWTRRGYDTREADPARVLQRLSRGLAAGDILLLHDGHAARTASGRPVVLEVLPALLARCQADGLRLVTLPEALQEGP